LWTLGLSSVRRMHFRAGEVFLIKEDE